MNTTLADTDFWEVYAKVLWTVNPMIALGANVYYSPSWLNTGASGTYASGTAKFTAPENFLPNGITMYVSGEAGYYWLGTTDFLPGVYTDNARHGRRGSSRLRLLERRYRVQLEGLYSRLALSRHEFVEGGV